MKTVILLFTFIFTVSMTARADLNSEVQEMFDKLGLAGNATPTGVYETQSRGHVTGGSVSVRTPYDVLQPFSVSLPNVRAGCQGIDVFLGGFSYINLDQLIEKLKAIGTSAVSYGFMLAIKTLCSQCESVMEFLETASRFANSMSMDTCRAGEAVANTLGNVIRTGQWGRCASIGSATGGFGDFIEAWRACADDITSGGSAAEGIDKERARPQGNLVWKGLKELPITDELKELVMSTMGTIIISEGNVRFVEGEVQIDQLVNGGSTNVLKCDTLDECLNPDPEPQTVEGLKKIVKDKLDEGFQAIITRTEPDDDLKAFIESLPAPAWRLLNVSSAYPAPLGYSYINQQSEALAVLSASYWYDMSFRYAVQGLYQSSYKGLTSTEEIDAFYRNAVKKHEDIYKELAKSENKLNNFDVVLQTIEFLDKKFMEGLESKGLLANYNFSKNSRLEDR